MVMFSDCKINLGLNILRRRSDGYHDIETCMLHVPWHDIIEIIPSESDKTYLTVLGNKVDCAPEKNLVMKAYNRLCEVAPLPPVHIVLQKVIPDGAGLGGGSSDATHTLIGLNEMFELGLDKSKLAEIAASIGADCPFFVYDTPMIAEGIGEILSPIEVDLKGYTILIAKPGNVNISTREAYAGVKPQVPSKSLRQLLSEPVSQWLGTVNNDFEASIFSIAPQVRQLKEHMIKSGAIYASMSGSGSSVYGIFDSDKMAEIALSSIRELPHCIFTIKN